MSLIRQNFTKVLPVQVRADYVEFFFFLNGQLLLWLTMCAWNKTEQKWIVVIEIHQPGKNRRNLEPRNPADTSTTLKGAKKSTFAKV